MNGRQLRPVAVVTQGQPLLDRRPTPARRRGIEPTIAGSVDDNQALLRLVAGGLGACIVPGLVLARGAAGVTVATQPLDATRTILAVTRRSSGDRNDAVVAAMIAVRDQRSGRSSADGRAVVSVGSSVR